jgi:hypothetical protein
MSQKNQPSKLGSFVACMFCSVVLFVIYVPAGIAMFVLSFVALAVGLTRTPGKEFGVK